MVEITDFLISYGYLVVFIWVLLDQVGLPIPAIPLMLVAGALAGMGELNLAAIIAVTVVASVPVDFFWYYAGKTRGGKVLNLLCAISLEPDYCVRNTESVFTRLGDSSLILAKFVPGLQTLAPPMAGLTGMSTGRFLLLDAVGAAVWSGLFASLGYFCHEQLEAVATQMAEYGVWAGITLVAILVTYIGYKLVHRQVFLRSLRMRRLQPRDVYSLLQEDAAIHVIDLRHSSDFDLLPRMVPKAVRVPMEAIERHLHRIPKTSDIVLYCS